MKSLKLHPPQRPRSRRIAGHAQLDHILDPYALQQKPENGTRCPQCGVVFLEGRWAWPTASNAPAAGELLCAACRRANENYPAGVVTLRGGFAREHKDELIRMARQQEAIEKQEHPMNRIMGVEDAADGVTINTTDIHLPRRIGEAIKRTWRGKFDVHFDEGGYFVRVDWTRER
jgi:NMD protein affecting ribosome stability and mRNA decay